MKWEEVHDASSHFMSLCPKTLPQCHIHVISNQIQKSLYISSFITLAHNQKSLNISSLLCQVCFKSISIFHLSLLQLIPRSLAAFPPSTNFSSSELRPLSCINSRDSFMSVQGLSLPNRIWSAPWIFTNLRNCSRLRGE